MRSLMRTFAAIVLVGLSPMFSNSAEAGLVIQVDTTAKTLTFSGSVTATPKDVVGFYGLTFETGAADPSVGQNEFLDVSVYTTVTSGNLDVAAFHFHPSVGMRLYFYVDTDVQNTFAMSGGPLSYAGLIAGSQNHLEAQIGNTLFPIEGTGTGVTLSFTAVPEPSSLMLVGGVALAAFGRRRRRGA